MAQIKIDDEKATRVIALRLREAGQLDGSAIDRRYGPGWCGDRDIVH
jgi:hypothetical protein